MTWLGAGAFTVGVGAALVAGAGTAAADPGSGDSSASSSKSTESAPPNERRSNTANDPGPEDRAATSSVDDRGDEQKDDGKDEKSENVPDDDAEGHDSDDEATGAMSDTLNPAVTKSDNLDTAETASADVEEPTAATAESLPVSMFRKHEKRLAAASQSLAVAEFPEAGGSGQLIAGADIQVSVASAATAEPASDTDTVPTPVIATIGTGAFPFGVAVLPNGTRVYVANSDYDDVSVIDTATNSVVGQVPMGGYAVRRLIMNPNGSRLYALGSSNVFVIDTATDTLIGKPISVYAKDAAITPDGSRLYITDGNWNGSVSIFDTATNTIIGEPISVARYPYGVAISPDGRRVYVANETLNPDIAGSVSVIDTATNTVIGSPIRVGADPVSVAISPDGKRVYVGNSRSGTISVIDTTTNKVVGKPIQTGDDPAFLAVSPDGARVYVTRPSDNAVVTVDTATSAVVGAPVRVGASPVSIAVSLDGKRIYVTNASDGTVSVIDAAEIDVDPIPTITASQRIRLAVQSSVQQFQLFIRAFVDNLVNASKPKPAEVERAAPASTAQLYSRLRQVTNGDDDGIYIEAVRTTDQAKTVKYIVYIGGTTGANFSGNQPKIKNLPSYAGVIDFRQVDKIAAALDAEDNRNAEVMLVGYSQGGMDAQNIAAARMFNVSTVVTFGSPIIRSAPTSGYQIVHLHADLDPVVGLSKRGAASLIFQRRPSNATFWTLLFDPTGFGLHENVATYESIGKMFDADSTSGYNSVKAKIKAFRGDVIHHY
ncbi:beta-propeller fold lactonase family protein [Mycobacterium sp. 236(2023)]|uniref:beta-propeller fold lactonase family protein n=1 Tax=Mycobacterium sp. 236(2023) TaxID=3038163 RepID=UPI00241528C4|nr:beta-propeller fold lactonase family protein [Mycobacterium sp. 236(2023)]MDG4668016.1 beta-propeller fold lactonase family protein [Mycobacterium sp. 236(2023)]